MMKTFKRNWKIGCQISFYTSDGKLSTTGIDKLIEHTCHQHETNN